MRRGCTMTWAKGAKWALALGLAGLGGVVMAQTATAPTGAGLPLMVGTTLAGVMSMPMLPAVCLPPPSLTVTLKLSVSLAVRSVPLWV